MNQVYKCKQVLLIYKEHYKMLKLRHREER
jgi:hypothetical protein